MCLLTLDDILKPLVIWEREQNLFKKQHTICSYSVASSQTSAKPQQLQFEKDRTCWRLPACLERLKYCSPSRLYRNTSPHIWYSLNTLHSQHTPISTFCILNLSQHYGAICWGEKCETLLACQWLQEVSKILDSFESRFWIHSYSSGLNTAWALLRLWHLPLYIFLSLSVISPLLHTSWTQLDMVSIETSRYCSTIKREEAKKQIKKGEREKIVYICLPQ